MVTRYTKGSVTSNTHTVHTCGPLMLLCLDISYAWLELTKAGNHLLYKDTYLERDCSWAKDESDPVTKLNFTFSWRARCFLTSVLIGRGTNLSRNNGLVSQEYFPLLITHLTSLLQFWTPCLWIFGLEPSWRSFLSCLCSLKMVLGQKFGKMTRSQL